MREIKFRAWWQGTPRIYSWDEIINFPPSQGQPDLVQTILGVRNPEWIPMQYTGLKDKNGKEIYEGDLVEIIGGEGELRKSVHEIIFKNGYFGISILGLQIVGLHAYNGNREETKECELLVRGNIYENPELLGK